MNSTVLQRVAQGDQASVGECLTRYGDLVWTLALRFCPGSQAAEEASRTIFAELWKDSVSAIPSTASEATRVAMFARRRLLDWYPDAIENQTNASDTGPQQQEQIRQTLQVDRDARTARECLDEIRPEELALIEQTLRSGQSSTRLAYRLKISIDTVHQHLRSVVSRVHEAILRTDRSARQHQTIRPFEEQQRRSELLAGHALGHLTPAETSELAATQDLSPLEASHFDRAVAAMELALGGIGTTPMPAALRSEILHDARLHLPMTDQYRRNESRPIPQPSSVPEIVTWSGTSVLVLLGILVCVFLVARFVIG